MPHTVDESPEPPAPVPTGYLRSGGTYPFPARASRQRRKSPQIVLAARACSGFQLRGRDAPGPRVTLKNAVAAGPRRPDHSARSGRIRGGASRGTRTSVPPVRVSVDRAQAHHRRCDTGTRVRSDDARWCPAPPPAEKGAPRISEPGFQCGACSRAFLAQQQGGVGQFSRGDAGNVCPRMVRRDDDRELVHSDHHRGDVGASMGVSTKPRSAAPERTRSVTAAEVTGEQPHAHIGCSVPVHQQPTGHQHLRDRL